MGKIRVKALGDEVIEKKQQKEAKKRAEVKKVAKTADEAEKQPSVAQSTDKPQTDRQKSESRQQKTDNKKSHSQKYQTVAQMIDKTKRYSLQDALALLPKLQRAKFDETVELHINTVEAGISGNVVLPHGTGKQVKVVIADEKLIADVEKGKIEFDILLAAPQMMSKLAKVARVLGPKGLMPNPKNGTVTPNPEEAAKKFAGGQINYKTEAKLPVLHLTVGKVSFGDKKLSENIKTIITSIKTEKIKNMTLKSTMSPGIKIQI